MSNGEQTSQEAQQDQPQDTNAAPGSQEGRHVLYRRPVALDREKHKNLRIAQTTDFRFAAALQTIPLTVSEFREAQKEYPIVFARAGEKQVMPVGVLGLRRDENLYVKADGTWDARYLPAYVRRYPFIFGESGNERLTLLFDEAWEGIGTERGQPLFENGAETQFMKNIVEFMQAFQNDFKMTEQFCKNIDEMGLLTTMQATAEMSTGQRFVIQNFLTVDENKLRSIDSTNLGRLFQTGELALVYAHLLSISNLSRLINLLGARNPQPTAGDESPEGAA